MENFVKHSILKQFFSFASCALCIFLLLCLILRTFVWKQDLCFLQAHLLLLLIDYESNHPLWHHKHFHGNPLAYFFFSYNKKLQSLSSNEVFVSIQIRYNFPVFCIHCPWPVYFKTPKFSSIALNSLKVHETVNSGYPQFSETIGCLRKQILSDQLYCTGLAGISSIMEEIHDTLYFMFCSI